MSIQQHSSEKQKGDVQRSIEDPTLFNSVDGGVSCIQPPQSSSLNEASIGASPATVLSKNNKNNFTNLCDSSPTSGSTPSPTPSSSSTSSPKKEKPFQDVLVPVTVQTNSGSLSTVLENIPLKRTHRRRSSNMNKDNLYCYKCKTKTTPEWRKGPDGPATLCNACGLSFAKKMKLEQIKLKNGGSQLQHSTFPIVLQSNIEGFETTPMQYMPSETASEFSAKPFSNDTSLQLPSSLSTKPVLATTPGTNPLASTTCVRPPKGSKKGSKSSKTHTFHQYNHGLNSQLPSGSVMKSTSQSKKSSKSSKSKSNSSQQIKIKSEPTSSTSNTSTVANDFSTTSTTSNPTFQQLNLQYVPTLPVDNNEMVCTQNNSNSNNNNYTNNTNTPLNVMSPNYVQTTIVSSLELGSISNSSESCYMGMDDGSSPPSVDPIQLDQNFSFISQSVPNISMPMPIKVESPEEANIFMDNHFDANVNTLVQSDCSGLFFSSDNNFANDSLSSPNQQNTQQQDQQDQQDQQQPISVSTSSFSSEYMQISPPLPTDEPIHLKLSESNNQNNNNNINNNNNNNNNNYPMNDIQDSYKNMNYFNHDDNFLVSLPTNIVHSSYSCGGNAMGFSSNQQSEASMLAFQNNTSTTIIDSYSVPSYNMDNMQHYHQYLQNIDSDDPFGVNSQSPLQIMNGTSL